MAWTERYISPAGGGLHDGTSEANAWTLAEAIAAPYAAGQRLNIKTGTYSETTNTRTFSIAGTTTAPIWLRGYNTAIGDLDADPVTAKPAITFTTGRLVISGAHHIVSNLNISGAFTTGAQLEVTGTGAFVDRVRVENTNAAAASSAIRAGIGMRVTRSWFKATSTATRVAESAASSIWMGDVAEGGGIGFDNTAGNVMYVQCVARAVGSNGFDITPAGGVVHISQCTAYGCGGNGIRFAGATVGSLCSWNLLVNNSVYGINQASGTNTNFIDRVGNVFFNNTSGKENGFGDSPSLAEIVETVIPFVNAGGGDLSLVASALARGGGMGLFENEIFTSYLDIGAVQRQEHFGDGRGIFRHMTRIG